MLVVIVHLDALKVDHVATAAWAHIARQVANLNKIVTLTSFVLLKHLVGGRVHLESERLCQSNSWTLDRRKLIFLGPICLLTHHFQLFVGKMGCVRDHLTPC